MTNPQKDAQVKLTKGLLDLITLQLLNTQPMHGYQVITKIRKDYGIYFGPSTIYPLLSSLEKKGFIGSEWNMDAERPRKIYHLTTTGKNMLTFTEESLTLICKKISFQITPISTPLTVDKTVKPKVHKPKLAVQIKG